MKSACAEKLKSIPEQLPGLGADDVVLAVLGHDRVLMDIVHGLERVNAGRELKRSSSRSEPKNLS